MGGRLFYLQNRKLLLECCQIENGSKVNDTDIGVKRFRPGYIAMEKEERSVIGFQRYGIGRYRISTG